jgi:hypothetical protein
MKETAVVAFRYIQVFRYYGKWNNFFQRTHLLKDYISAYVLICQFPENVGNGDLPIFLLQ